MSIAKGLTLFTSDSRPRYATDILNVLALPIGAFYHFRYEAKYLTSEIQNEFENQTPEGTRVLIVFRDETAAESPFMVPVRWATVNSVERISDFYVIRFCLEGYPVFSKDYTGSKEDIQLLCGRFLLQFSEASRHLPVQLGLTPLVELRSTADKNSWIEAVKRLAQHGTFSTSHFVRIAGITDRRGKNLRLSVDGEYILTEWQYAVLQLDYFAVNYGPHRAELKLTSDPKLVRVASIGSITLDSRYDSRKTWIQGGSVPGTTATELHISTSGGGDAMPQTEVKLPIVVARSKRMLMWRIGASTIGAGLIATPGILGSGTDPALRILTALCGALILAFGTNIRPSSA